MARIVFPVLYTDHLMSARFGSILKWCDVGTSLVFKQVADEELRRMMLHSWDKASVTRRSTVEMGFGSKSWERLITNGTETMIQASIARVGRTSCTLRFDIQTTSGEAIARVECVNVSVDEETTSKPVEVPGGDKLRELATNVPALEAPNARQRPADAFVWRTAVRQSDCDKLGHINNANYGYLIEDARVAANMAGLLKEPAFADSDDPCVLSIGYLGQPRLGDALDIAVWADLEVGGLGFEFCVGEKVVATATLAARKQQVSPRSNM